MCHHQVVKIRFLLYNNKKGALEKPICCRIFVYCVKIYCCDGLIKPGQPICRLERFGETSGQREKLGGMDVGTWRYQRDTEKLDVQMDEG